MKKASRFSPSDERLSRVFHFYLGGKLKECTVCINMLNELDLSEHDVQFLCVKEGSVSRNNSEIRLDGLIGVKEYTALREMDRFFRNLDAQFRDCITVVKICHCILSWFVTLEKGEVVVKRGPLTR